MGQKVHPKGLRIGITKDWDSRWFATKRNYVEYLLEDHRLRGLIKKKAYNSGVSKVEIERAGGKIKATIHAAKPGMIIGRGGAGVEDLRKMLEKASGRQVNLNIVEIKLPEVDAQLVAENIAQQLEKRISFRRAMKQAVGRAMRLGARGIRVIVAGRLGGAEIARRERDWEGTVPLHTLRADIDYGFTEAATTFGRIGVKVWVFKGENLVARPDRGGRDRRGPGGGPRGDRGPGGPRGQGGGRPGGFGGGRPAPGRPGVGSPRPGAPRPSVPGNRPDRPAPEAAPDARPAETIGKEDGGDAGTEAG